MRMKSITTTLLVIQLVSSIVIYQHGEVEAQVLDQLLNPNQNALTNQPGDQANTLGAGGVGSGRSQLAEQNPIFKRVMNMMSVNVPVFYEMVKDGSSMGINVLSGLVRVDRGREAERSGLQGPRPLSVRVFGVPVYERGRRVQDVAPADGAKPPRDPKAAKPNNDDAEEELPIES